MTALKSLGHRKHYTYSILLSFSTPACVQPPLLSAWLCLLLLIMTSAPPGTLVQDG